MSAELIGILVVGIPLLAVGVALARLGLSVSTAPIDGAQGERQDSPAESAATASGRMHVYRGPANGSSGLVPDPSRSSSVMAASPASVGRCSPRPQISASRRRRCQSVDRDWVPGAPLHGKIGQVQLRAEHLQQLPLDAGRPAVGTGVGPAPLGVAPEDLLEGVGELVGQVAGPALAEVLPPEGSSFTWTSKDGE